METGFPLKNRPEHAENTPGLHHTPNYYRPPHNLCQLGLFRKKMFSLKMCLVFIRKLAKCIKLVLH